jgi:uncharacterized LabA/DUF88 family protein
MEGKHSVLRQQTNTALFVDFDNMFINLKSQHDYHKAELEFATKPHQWLSWLENSMENSFLPDIQRRILIRRCYLNPQVFGEFRLFFIRAAFEVVDCPPLTRQGKTSSDIHMVMDILDTLNQYTYFNEFIILSADTDFTPVLLRLRKYGRYSVVVSTGNVSPAYRSACDTLVSPDTFIQGSLGFDLETTTDLSPVARSIGEFVKKSETPVSLSAVAAYLNKSGFNKDRNWFGKGSFKNLLMELMALSVTDFQLSSDAAYLVSSDQSVYSGTHLKESKQKASIVYGNKKDIDKLQEKIFEYPEIADKVCELTDIPYLTSTHFCTILRGLEREINGNGYQISRTSKAVRDICTESGVPIGRNQINYILHAISHTGYRFGRNEEKADVLGQALVESTLEVCRLAQFVPNETEISQIKDWILGHLNQVD